MSEIPKAVAAAYGLEGRPVEPVHSLINRTFRVERSGGEQLILQRLHPVFGAEVHDDIEAVTGYLIALGLETPRLIRTGNGDLWCRSEDGAIWRAQTYITGRVLHAIETTAQAASAGELVARFHRALSSFEHDFAHVRQGAHDTARHLERLELALRRTEGDAAAQELGREILDLAGGARLDFESLPKRIGHGDLKISNVLFADDGSGVARCLIDLDTLGRQLIPYELGDALRSWCNPGGESHAAPAVDQEIFVAALRGYANGAPGLLSEPEAASVVAGLETVSIELSARFCLDVFEDRYFGYDPARFASRKDHNRARARAQLLLARSVRSRRATLERIATSCLGGGR